MARNKKKSARRPSSAGRPSVRRRPVRGKTQGKAQPPGETLQGGERLQKVLAHAGVASRRECEELIRQGRVDVDGRPVDQLGVRVDPERQEIRLDGELVRTRRREYWLVHKPPGVVSTQRDPAGRPRVVDLVQTSERLFPVGRLDKSSAGLMVVTNDGELANRLAHPRYHVPKTYVVTVVGQVRPQSLDRLRKGVHLAEGKARVERLAIKRRRRESTVLEMVLTEGRNREIRRLLARVGHKVVRLVRTAIGPLKLADLPAGASRRLTPAELRQLRRMAGDEPVN